METLRTALEVAGDTGTLLRVANRALLVKPLVIQGSTESCQRDIICLEPHFVVPVYTCVVNPFARFKINHGASDIVAQEAVWQSYHLTTIRAIIEFIF